MEITREVKEESQPKIHKKVESILMNTISFRGVLVIGVIFMILVLLVTGASIFTPTKYITEEKGLWQCNEASETFDATKCTGWNSYPAVQSGVEQKKDAYTYLAIGPFGQLNRDVSLGLKLKNVFCEKTDHVNFHLNITYSFETFEKWELMSSVLFKKETAQNVHVHCEKKNEFCDIKFKVYDDFFADTYERFDIYKMQTDLADKSLFEKAEFYAVVQTYNSKACVFETMWRVACSIFACVCIIVYAILLRSYYAIKWPIEILLTILLNMLLIFFNNPFSVLEQFTNANFFYIIDSLFESLFVGYFLFYVLAFFNAVRRPEKSKDMKALIVRAIFAIIMGTCSFGVLLSIRKSINTSSYFDASTVTSIFIALFAVCMVIYCYWLFFELVRSFSERRKMDGKKKHRTIIFGFVTFGCVTFILTAYIVVYMSGYTISNLFIALLSYVNLYCYFVTVLAIPIRDNKINKDYSKISKLDIQLTVQEYDDNDELIIQDLEEEGVLNDDDHIQINDTN